MPVYCVRVMLNLVIVALLQGFTVVHAGPFVGKKKDSTYYIGW